MSWQRRSIFTLVLLAALSCLGIALPTAAEPQASGSLAGQLLVASPSMGDPRFERTVILMVKHDNQGAFGIVINKPIGEHPIARLLELLGDKEAPVSGEVRVFAGGPVQRELGFVIHSADYHQSGTVDIDGRVAMTASRDILRDIAGNNGPKKSLIAFGYAGWAPNQLEGEMARRTWTTAPADPALVFDEDREKLWDIGYSKRGLDL